MRTVAGDKPEAIQPPPADLPPPAAAPLATVPQAGALAEVVRGHRSTSLDLSKLADKKRLFRAMQSGDLKVQQLAGQTFKAVDWLVHPKELTNKDTGELDQAVRTVFFLDSGATLEMFGVGIPSAVAAYERTFGPAPWSPPAEFAIKEQQTAGGRRMFILEPI